MRHSGDRKERKLWDVKEREWMGVGYQARERFLRDKGATCVS